jgi:hypothetical protein
MSNDNLNKSSSEELVGWLLTPEEIEAVNGGNYCQYVQSGGEFKQTCPEK